MDHVDVGTDDFLELLLVGDDTDESRRLRDTFEKAAVNATLYTVVTREAALDVLFQRGEDASASPPDIVLVDLSAADACELLETIKSDRRVGHIPVLVLVDDDTADEIARYYEHGANACLKRTDEYDRLVSATESFWCNRVQLPRNGT